MLHDRPYMRAGYDQTWRFSPLVVLLITLVAVYVLQSLFRLGGAPVLEQWFGLNGPGLLDGKVWTLLTYAFLHDPNNLFHLLFNLIGVFFIGRILEADVGPQKFVAVFIIGALSGGLLFLAINPTQGNLLGASGALLAMLTVFCLRRPDEPITFLLFFVLPVTLKPKFILMFVGGVTLFSFLFLEVFGPNTDGIAHSAHLGGILGGYLTLRYVLPRDDWFESIGRKTRRATTAARPARRKPAAKRAYRVNIAHRGEDRQHLRAEIDRILDKINTQGFGSLSEDEKKTLDRARDILSR